MKPLSTFKKTQDTLLRRSTVLSLHPSDSVPCRNPQQVEAYLHYSKNRTKLAGV